MGGGLPNVRDRALAEASNLLGYRARELPYVRLFDTGGYKTLRTITLLTNNAKYTSYSIPIIIGKLKGAGSRQYFIRFPLP